MQCLGGYGYCDDFPVEQYYRDARIHPIHEGTTAIHGMDLLGRKVTMSRAGTGTTSKDGAAFKLYLAEIKVTLESARAVAEFQPLVNQLDEALVTLQAVTTHLAALAASAGTERYLADATLYLELFGIITLAWQWLKQGITVKMKQPTAPSSDADFYQGKLAALRYFFVYELPKTLGLASTLMADSPLTVELDSKILG